jgi:hypothetical protein
MDYDALDTCGADLISVNCAASTPSELSCLVNYSGAGSARPGIRLRATLRNAGRAFLRPPSKADTILTGFDGSSTNWSTSLSPNPNTINNQLLNNSNATITFYGRLTPASANPSSGSVAVLPFHRLTDPTDATLGWFTANRWHDQTYYAVSTG